MERRRFLGSIAYPAIGAAAVAVLTPRLAPTALARAQELSRHTGTPKAVARDESFWLEVQQSFTVDRSLINLNNGGVSPSPAIVQQAMKRHLGIAAKSRPAECLFRKKITFSDSLI